MNPQNTIYVPSSKVVDYAMSLPPNYLPEPKVSFKSKTSKSIAKKKKEDLKRTQSMPVKNEGAHHILGKKFNFLKGCRQDNFVIGMGPNRQVGLVRPVCLTPSLTPNFNFEQDESTAQNQE